MSTHVLPNHLGLPPPLKLDLMDAGRAVGWISGHQVGFRGFADEVEAAHAAWVAYRTLSHRLARRYGTRPIPVDIEPVALQRRGEDEVILAGGRSIATLVRPGPHSPTGPDSFGFEIAIPLVTDELGMRSKAYFIYRTLRKAGTRWALWESAAAAEPLPRPASPAVSETDEATADVAGPVEDSGPEGIDTTNHQRGGYSDVTQHSGQRPWWLRAVPWRRARRDGSQTRLTFGRAPVGRLIEPNDPVLKRADYGVELLLPRGLGPVTGISAAKVIDTALTRRTAARSLEPVALVA